MIPQVQVLRPMSLDSSALSSQSIIPRDTISLCDRCTEQDQEWYAAQRDDDGSACESDDRSAADSDDIAGASDQRTCKGIAALVADASMIRVLTKGQLYIIREPQELNKDIPRPKQRAQCLAQTTTVLCSRPAEHGRGC